MGTYLFIETRILISAAVSLLLSSRQNVLRNGITKLDEKVRVMWFSGVESKCDNGHQTHCSVPITLMGSSLARLFFVSRLYYVI